VAIDGKVLRRPFDRASGTSALHMVGAWGCEQRPVLAQAGTGAKSNEVAAVPALLRPLSLRGTVVTADALHRQRATARQVVDQGGDRALALRGNQGTPHGDVVRLLDDPAAKAAAAGTTAGTARCLLSAALLPERLNEVARSHRGTENQLHRRLDTGGSMSSWTKTRTAPAWDTAPRPWPPRDTWP